MARSRALLGALVWLALALPSAAAAADPPTEFTVDTGDDGVDADINDQFFSCATTDLKCSLRAAVQQANALPGPHTIHLPVGTFVLSISGPGEDAAATGDLDITSEITIVGEGASASIIDAKKLKDRAFDVKPGGSLTLTDLSVVNGKNAKGDFDPGAPGETSGGCLRSEGALSFLRTIVAQCSSLDDGGCVSVIGGTLATDTTIIDTCRAKNEGGGLWIAAGSAALVKTAVTNNQAATGGGIVTRGDLVLRNVTIDSNRTKSGGSVTLLGSASATLNNVTLSGLATNLDASGTSGTVLVSNSIIDAGKGGKLPSCASPVTSAGGNVEPGTSCGFTDLLDQQNAPPLLLPLAFNGALVPTRGLDRDSPAIDHGVDATCEATDARGAPRDDVRFVGVAICDSGSFEFLQP